MTTLGTSPSPSDLHSHNFQHPYWLAYSDPLNRFCLLHFPATLSGLEGGVTSPTATPQRNLQAVQPSACLNPSALRLPHNSPRKPNTFLTSNDIHTSLSILFEPYQRCGRTLSAPLPLSFSDGAWFSRPCTPQSKGHRQLRPDKAPTIQAVRQKWGARGTRSLCNSLALRFFSRGRFWRMSSTPTRAPHCVRRCPLRRE